MHNKISFAFFGTSHVAVYVLEELSKAGYLPELVITMPDRQSGRGMELMAPAVKKWALKCGVALIQPEELDDSFVYDLRAAEVDVCVVCDYGKIIQKEILGLPQKGFLNVHPSLLPRFRGASPIRSSILKNEKNTGVTIMLMDEKMDHGPILAQKNVSVDHWPPLLYDFERTLMIEGGKLLAHVMPLWLSGEIDPQEQNHDVATYCGKISKEDGELNLSGDPYQNLLKIRAYEGWPGTFAFFQRDDPSTSSGQAKRIRVKILDAHIESGMLVIERVIPEGKKEMAYQDFLRSGVKPVS